MKERTFKDELTKEWYIVGKIGIPILILAVAAFYIWGDRLIHSNLECYVFRIIHIYCPGCGGTRAFYYFIRGRLIYSFLLNPFVPYCLLLYPVFMVNTFLFKHTKKLGFQGFPITILTYISVGILLGQCIIRNILNLGFHLTVL